METLIEKQRELSLHPVYQSLNSLENLRTFMGHHVFAVWDFMSLLKSLQQKITCVTVPWTPSGYPSEMVRLINQIVLGEESDVDLDGNPISHFELYLKAMEEVGAPTSCIRDFLATWDVDQIPQGAREFVTFNLDVAQHGHVVEVAASFFFGREKLIPDMFRSIVDVLKRENVEAPTLLYYLERHIEVDDGEHGPLAMKCLDLLVGDDESLKNLSLKAAMEALGARAGLWDSVLLKL
jgi:hypothetical protein